MVVGGGIGVSSHKNEYRPGVRIGNWVEDQFGDQAPDAPELRVAPIEPAPMPEHSARIVDPKSDEPAELLFSHGQTMGMSYGASMNDLHYTHPDSRAHGAESLDRAHRTFFWGSKMMDRTCATARHAPARPEGGPVRLLTFGAAYYGRCPLSDPNARTLLTDAKRAQWAAEQKPTRPVAADMYMTTNSVAHAHARN